MLRVRGVERGQQARGAGDHADHEAASDPLSRWTASATAFRTPSFARGTAGAFEGAGEQGLVPDTVRHGGEMDALADDLGLTDAAPGCRFLMIRDRCRRIR
jgi:hypothetical protein